MTKTEAFIQCFSNKPTKDRRLGPCMNHKRQIYLDDEQAKLFFNIIPRKNKKSNNGPWFQRTKTCSLKVQAAELLDELMIKRPPVSMASVDVASSASSASSASVAVAVRCEKKKKRVGSAMAVTRGQCGRSAKRVKSILSVDSSSASNAESIRSVRDSRRRESAAWDEEEEEEDVVQH